MPAPLSIVVPTLNSAPDLAAAVEALMPGLAAGLIAELVVSDGGSSDDTQDLAEALGAVWVAGPPGRGGQLARGVAAAQAPWLLLLHADTRLSPHWVEAVARHIAEAPKSAGYFRLAFRADGLAPRMVAFWANARSRLFGLPYGDQGLLVRRDVLAAAGGVPALPLMEDVALARALQGRLVPLSATAHTSAARYLAEGWLRRGGRNLWTLARYLAGADPAVLAARYGRRKPTDQRSEG